MEDVGRYALCLGGTLGLLWTFRRLAFPLGLLDHPRGHKCHEGCVPLVGGVGIFAGLCLSLWLIPGLSGGPAPLLACGGLLVAVGVIDDLRDWPAWTRFAAQGAAAALMVVWGGVVLETLGGLVPGWSVDLGWLGIPLTVFATVGVINALNMSDGMDGLAGGLTLVALLPSALLAAGAGRGVDAALILLIAMAVLAFLVFNWPVPGRPRALVFLGDAGSTLLGFLIAWFLVDLSQGPDRAMTPVIALWLFAIPLMDTVALMLRRTLNGRSPFSADRKHLHHLLLEAGYKVPEAGSIIMGLAVACALVGVIGLEYGVPQWVMFAGFALLFAGYFWVLGHAWRVITVLRRDVEQHGTLLGPRRLAAPRRRSP